MIGIFVDLDGVLWFSESAHKDAFKMTFGDLIENATELIDQTWKFGESTEKYIERLLRLNNIDSSEIKISELAVQKRKLAAEISCIPLNSSLIDSLSEIRDMGVLISLVSSSSPPNVRKFLDISKLHNFFDCVIDSSMVPAPKPDPSCYSLAMSNLGLAPHKCLVIEDSEPGRVAAMSAGIDKILIYPDDFPDQQFTYTLISSLPKAI